MSTSFSLQEAFTAACRQIGEMSVRLELLEAENEELRNRLIQPCCEPAPE